MTKKYIIYKTTCIINNKYYIGAHSTNNLNDGYLGSGKLILRSIIKYGKENHIRDILYSLDSKDSMYSKERDIVNKDLLSDNLCMNLKEGGFGGFSENCLFANKEASSIRMKKMHELGKINYKSRSKRPPHSEETKQKMKLSSIEPSLGEKNSQFGTCWVNDKISTKKIKLDELNKHLELGWIRGRAFKPRNKMHL